MSVFMKTGFEASVLLVWPVWGHETQTERSRLKPSAFFFFFFSCYCQQKSQQKTFAFNEQFKKQNSLIQTSSGDA